MQLKRLLFCGRKGGERMSKNKTIRTEGDIKSESWADSFGQKFCDNLNWNVCQEAVDNVKMGRATPDKDYYRCLRMINKYKTREAYFKRIIKINRVTHQV